MTMNLALQYTLVFLCIAGALVWILVKARKKHKDGGACCGCALSEACEKKRVRKPEKCDRADNDNTLKK